MKRRGGILLEAVIAMLLLSLLVVASAQLASSMNRQSRLLAQRAVALQECQHALSAASNIAASQWSSESLSSIQLPREAAEILPEGELKVSQAPAEGGEGTRVKATVRWKPFAHSEKAETSLSLWRFDLKNSAQGGSP